MKKVSAAAIVVAIGFLVGSMAYAASNGNAGDVNGLTQFRNEALQGGPAAGDTVVQSGGQTTDHIRLAKLDKEATNRGTKTGTEAEERDLPQYGPWMMGGYYGMGPGMMYGYGPGYGMGPWMMGAGYGPGYGSYGYCPMW